jgi:hypothetical protein
MPELLEEMPKVKRAGRKPKYPFTEWFSNGDKAVQLTQGKDFDCSVTTMRHNLYRHSDNNDLKIETVTPADSEGVIVFKVVGKKSQSKKTTKKATSKKS